MSISARRRARRLATTNVARSGASLHPYYTLVALLLPALACMLAFGTRRDCGIAVCCLLLGLLATPDDVTPAAQKCKPTAGDHTQEAGDAPATTPSPRSKQAREAATLLDVEQLESHVLDAVPELANYGRPHQWHLVCDVDRGKARVLRLLDPPNGDFTLRVTSQLDCGVDELLSLVVELDLMPSWNTFCGYGEIFHRVSCVDLYAGGACRLPFPVPRYIIMLRAKLLDLMATLGCMVVVARTPHGKSFRNEHPPFDARLPAQMQGQRQLPLRFAVCALTPDTVAHRVAFDLVVCVQLSAAAYVPGWVLDFLMRRVVPWLCRRVLSLVHDIATKPDSEFRRRMRQDATGVYRHIRDAIY